CGDDNIQVCYPTTPAQMFHLLRWQLLRPIRKPLVVMTPKSLLRKAEAASPLEDLTQRTYRRLIPDPLAPAPEQVTRLLLCTGKVYYDLAHARADRKDASVTIARLEQLYPYPAEEVEALLASLPAITE